jgi:hypothetical protein
MGIRLLWIGQLQITEATSDEADYTISKSVAVAKDKPRCSLDICKG